MLCSHRQSLLELHLKRALANQLVPLGVPQQRFPQVVQKGEGIPPSASRIAPSSVNRAVLAQTDMRRVD